MTPTTPTKLAKPSGIPGPKPSGIPGARSRSASNANQTMPNPDQEYLNKTFQEAIRANDPAQHRLSTGSTSTSASSTAGLSPTATSSAGFGFGGANGGRRSLGGAGGASGIARPSSSASNASSSNIVTTTTTTTTMGSPRGRTKTPMSTTGARGTSRPPSRSSDFFSSSSAGGVSINGMGAHHNHGSKSQAQKSFEVGENVRIESLGYEGTLRYVGDIEGKPGVWAGVELSGGFAGKGKNDGSVNGTRYFSCPEKCGVFVAYSKLSPPTVGPGARPESVTSSRQSMPPAYPPPTIANGRATPLGSGISAGAGRTTPASAATTTINGRITPSSRAAISSATTRASSGSFSNGRITPGSASAAATAAAANGRVTPANSAGRITPGVTPTSRTTARRTFTNDFIHSKPSNVATNAGGGYLDTSMSTPEPGLITSPTSASAFPAGTTTTPKSARGLGFGLGSPGKGRVPGRPRIPSSIAMPPPASPSRGLNRSISLNDSDERESFIRSGGGGTGERERPVPVPSVSTPTRTPSRSQHFQQVQQQLQMQRQEEEESQLVIEGLKSRIEALEYDNERLRTMNEVAKKTVEEANRMAVEAEREREAAVKAAAEAEAAAVNADAASSVAGVSVKIEGEETEHGEEGESKAEVDEDATMVNPPAEKDEDGGAAATAAAEVVKEKLVAVEGERDEALKRISNLEEELQTVRRSLEELTTAKEGIIQDLTSQSSELKELKELAEQRCELLQTTIDEQEEEIKKLEETLKEKEGKEKEAEELIKKQNEEILNLTTLVEQVQQELEQEKVELGAQIDELRTAGQETIGLYEEQLRAAQTARYELEAQISTLEANAQRLQTASGEPLASVPAEPSATEIDNETLREQVAYLTNRLAATEERLEDTRMATENEELALNERMVQLKEKEEQWKLEMAEERREIERLNRAEASARRRAEEAEEALRDERLHLETTRHEVEALRQELANLEGLAGPTATNGATSDPATTTGGKRTKTQYESEIARLQSALDEATRFNQGPESLQVQLQNTISTLQDENAALHQKSLENEAKIEALTSALQDKVGEAETLKKKLNRDVGINNGLQDSKSAPSPSIPNKYEKHELNAAREEITGLKHIVQELQKENLTSSQRMKLLESDNSMLQSEVNQLKQEVQILEGNLDKSLAEAGTSSVDDASEVSNADVDTLRRLLKEQRSRYEAETEQMRKKLTEVEMTSNRKIHDLNKEISELEVLIESKIYREDELEQELEQMKSKLSRHKKTSKNGSETTPPRRSFSSSSNNRPNSLISISSSNTNSSQTNLGQPVCEMCEQPGHDIFNCTLLNEGPATTNQSSTSQPKVNGKTMQDLYCEDCEGYGHTAVNCPHSLDVF